MPKSKPRASAPKPKPSKNGKPITRAERVAKWVSKERPLRPVSNEYFWDVLDRSEAGARKAIADLGAKWSRPPLGATERQTREVDYYSHLLSLIWLIDRAVASGCLQRVGWACATFGLYLRSDAGLAIDGADAAMLRVMPAVEANARKVEKRHEIILQLLAALPAIQKGKIIGHAREIRNKWPKGKKRPKVRTIQDFLGKHFAEKQRAES